MPTATQKAKPIKLLILDVDGILTTGVIYYGSQGTEMKGFHTHDGIGIRLMQKAGIEIAVISGHHSETVSNRLAKFDIKHVHLGIDDKLPVYEALKQKLNLEDKEIAYMGDDLPDLPILKRAGLAMTVMQAPGIIREHVDFITEKKPGKGAVRDACEFILEAKDQYKSLIESYLS